LGELGGTSPKRRNRLMSKLTILPINLGAESGWVIAVHFNLDPPV
jgi:hypothetical protein